MSDMILETGKLSVVTTLGLTGIFASVGAASGNPSDWIHILASVGLGGVIAMFLVRWLVNQHAIQADKMDAMANRMLEMVKASTEVSTKLNDTATLLERASVKRGEEVRLLVAALASRPCLVMLLGKESKGRMSKEFNELSKHLQKIEENQEHE